MRIGAHVLVAGGLVEGVRRAREAGSECMQLFHKSPRRWRESPRAPEEEEAFREACAEADISPVFSHASYLINPGTRDDDLWSLSTNALADEIARADRIAAAGLVMHLGTRYSESDGQCAQRIADTAQRAYDLCGSCLTPLVIENSAGAGTQFGSRVDQVALTLMELRERDMPAAICIDSCHAYAAGIDLRADAGWAHIADTLEASCGTEALVLIHANDSRGDLGSHLDRHEWIGDGAITTGGFAAMFREERLAGAAAIVEMSGDPEVKDRENIRRLRTLRDAAGASGARVPPPGEVG